MSNDSSDSDDEAQAPKGKSSKASLRIVSREGRALSKPSLRADDVLSPEVSVLEAVP